MFGSTAGTSIILYWLVLTAISIYISVRHGEFFATETKEEDKAE
jgi:hypothetical protein